MPLLRLLPFALVGCASGAARVGTLVLNVDPVSTVDAPDGLLESTTLRTETSEGALLVWQDTDAAEAGLAALGLINADVTWLDLPVEMVDPSEPAADVPYVTLVRVPAPWYATRGMVIGRMQKAIPEYEAVEGLIHKDFVLTDDRELGGLYRWVNREAADAFYDEAWHADIEDRYGVPADLLRFEAVDPDWP
ncbi:MAG: hypothetical protein AAGA48_17230 [Myxococcota bacterium]